MVRMYDEEEWWERIFLGQFHNSEIKKKFLTQSVERRFFRMSSYQIFNPKN